MAEQKRKYSSINSSGDGFTYQQGNTVRRAAPVPEAPREMPSADPQPVRRRSRQELEAAHERKRAAKRNIRRAGVMDLRHAVFLTAVTVIFALVCLEYVYLRTSISGYVSSISYLQEQIEELKSDNDAAESRINASSTITDVSDEAEDLGMDYPDSSSIITYSIDEDDYMNQYSEISGR